MGLIDNQLISQLEKRAWTEEPNTNSFLDTRDREHAVSFCETNNIDFLNIS